jgi:hypothetical protein
MKDIGVKITKSQLCKLDNRLELDGKKLMNWKWVAVAIFKTISVNCMDQLSVFYQ